jgi:hypothetical protein
VASGRRGCRAPRPCGPPRVFKARCRAGGASSMERNEEVPTPTVLHGQPLSGRCPPPGGFSFHGSSSPARCEQAGDGRGRSIRISPRRATRFPARASRLAGSSSEEGGRLERHGVTRASASNGAQRA